MLMNSKIQNQVSPTASSLVVFVTHRKANGYNQIEPLFKPTRETPNSGLPNNINYLGRGLDCETKIPPVANSVSLGNGVICNHSLPKHPILFFDIYCPQSKGNPVVK